MDRLTEPGAVASLLATTPEAGMLRTCGISLEWASRQIGKWAEAGTEAQLANLTAEIWKLSDARLQLVWEKGTRALDCTFD